VRVVVTGQVGLDKRPFLERVVEIAAGEGHEVVLCNVGQMMYAEAPDVGDGKILDLPLNRLHALRRSVFKDVLARAGSAPHTIVNTHATFRWRHGLFYAFDYDQMKQLDADLYVVLVDNIDRVHYRLRRDGHADHTLKDLMVWREEEILATELLAQIVRGHGCFYICARGADDITGPAATLSRLILHPDRRKAYLSFPMSHLDHETPPAALADIEAFRREMKRHFICFDPGDVDEKVLALVGLKAAEEGRRTVEFGPPDSHAVMQTDELLSIIPDIDGQIYARDFKLIDQSDMIISMIPELEGGRPGLSSGVERELQHAHEATKDVFVIWRSSTDPSPFVTETATRLFNSIEQAVEFFLDSHYASPPAGSLFQ